MNLKTEIIFRDIGLIIGTIALIALFITLITQ